jgi:hypothetical protein
MATQIGPAKAFGSRRNRIKACHRA